MKFNSTLITTAMLAVVLICFFLPFAEVSCNNVSFFSLSGKDMLRGREMTKADVLEFAKKANLEKEMNAMNPDEAQNKNIPPNPWAIAAFVMSAIGVLTGVVLRRFGTVIHLVTSAVAAIALLGLQFSLNSEFSYSNSFVNIEVNIKYLAGYWLSLILSGLVAGISVIAFIVERKKALRQIISTTQNINEAPAPINTPVE